MDLGKALKSLARRTAAFDRSKLDVVTGVRCALAIAIPLVVGLATGHPGGGAYVAAGALLTAFAYFQPGYRRRAAIMVTMAAWLAATTLVGGLVGGWTWVVVLLAGLSAYGAGLLVALGPNAAMVATLGTAELVIASSQPVGATTALVHAAQVVVGGLLATLVLAGPWPRRPLGPERRALSAAYRNLSGYAADIPLDRTVLPDPGPIEDVRATLASASRHTRWGRGRSIQSLADEAVRVRESLGALAVARNHLVSRRTGEALTTPGTSDPAADRSRVGTDGLDEAVGAVDAVARSTAALLNRLASSIGGDTPSGSLTALHDAIGEAVATLGRLGTPGPGAVVSPASWDEAAQVDHDLDLVRSLHGQLRSVQRIVTAGVLTTKDRAATSVMAGPSTATLVRNDTELLRANLSLQSTAFRHALRLCVAAIVATLLYRTLPGTHDYWIVIATLMVLKPDFGTTVTRGVARAAGTVTGAVLATLVAAELRPGPVALAVLVSVLAAVVFTVYQTNYGVYAVGLTAMTVFFAAFGGLPPLTAATDRTVDNLIGIALAFALFFLWPTWAAREVPRQLARLLTTQASFARLVLDGYIDPAGLDQRALDQAASDARLDRTNAEAVVERMGSEPSTSGPLTIKVADGVVSGVHRFGLATVALRTAEGTQHQPMPELVTLRDGITTAMTGLAAALDGEPTAPMPDLRRLHAELRDELAPLGTVAGSAPASDDRVVVVGETDFLVDAVNTIARLVSDLCPVPAEYCGVYLLVAGRNTPMAYPDRRTPLLESYENAAVIVSGITAEQVTLRTPCPGYDVAGLIDHMVEAAYRAAALGRGRTPPPGDDSPHVELADAPAQLRRAAEEAAQAWGDDSRLSSSFTMPWGEEYSGATLVNMYLAELAAHAWDLALATGQLDRLDPSLAVPALDGARAMIKPEYRDMVATGSPFGAEVPPPPDADDWERLAAFMGRDPRASLDR